jgi:dolichyl-diphosphooligosaccharide--protein glycosyltransferase
VEHGYAQFFAWYDDQSWYPLGRPIGTTIYPGLQLTAAALYWAATQIQGPFAGVTLNGVCVFIPAIFGVLTTAFTSLLAFEVTGDGAAACAAGAVMAVIPSHLMRSVAGGFDNESIAVCAIAATFYLWCRSVRTPASWPWGVAAAVSYVYMVCAWGGYTFVVNLVGLHAGWLALSTVDVSGVLVTQSLAAFTMADPTSLHRSYSLFYGLGTLGAVQVPVVGWAPLKSLEQLAPLAVFLGLQLLQLNWVWRQRQPGSMGGKAVAGHKQLAVLLQLAAGGAAVGGGALYLASQTGYLGPLSARVRGLFVRHTRTGNPLVDSVAEHQSTRPQMYWGYFHATCYAGPLGLALTAVRAASGKPAASFMLLYAWVRMKGESERDGRYGLFGRIETRKFYFGISHLVKM